jgi:hypothetical protein
VGTNLPWRKRRIKKVYRKEKKKTRRVQNALAKQNLVD